MTRNRKPCITVTVVVVKTPVAELLRQRLRRLVNQPKTQNTVSVVPAAVCKSESRARAGTGTRARAGRCALAGRAGGG